MSSARNVGRGPDNKRLSTTVWKHVLARSDSGPHYKEQHPHGHGGLASGVPPFSRTVPSENETVTTMLSKVSRVCNLNQTLCMQIMLTH